MSVLGNESSPEVNAYEEYGFTTFVVVTWLMIFVPIVGVAALWRAKTSMLDVPQKGQRAWTRFNEQLKALSEQREARALAAERAQAIKEASQASSHRRERIPQRIRDEVWRRDRGRCGECGSRYRLEFDHMVPVSRGGSNTARNLELLCEPCNRRKGAKIG